MLVDVAVLKSLTGSAASSVDVRVDHSTVLADAAATNRARATTVAAAREGKARIIATSQGGERGSGARGLYVLWYRDTPH